MIVLILRMLVPDFDNDSFDFENVSSWFDNDSFDFENVSSWFWMLVLDFDNDSFDFEILFLKVDELFVCFELFIVCFVWVCLCVWKVVFHATSLLKALYNKACWNEYAHAQHSVFHIRAESMHLSVSWRLCSQWQQCWQPFLSVSEEAQPSFRPLV